MKNYVVEILMKHHQAIENMAKKQIRQRVGLSQVMSYEDIVNEVYAYALEGKLSLDHGNIFTTIFYTIQNITRKEVRRLKRQSPLWDMEQVEIEDTYQVGKRISYERNGKEVAYIRYTDTVTYTRTETIVTGMKQVAKRADVHTIQKKAIASNFADAVNFRLDVANMFDEMEYKVFRLMAQGKKKKEIDEMMNQRCDRIYKRIEKKLMEYMMEA
jgi:hypothetical protein